jgi:hypothetical protein
MATFYLTSTNTIVAKHTIASPSLLPTHDGSYIVSHLRKDTPSQLINFVISMANPHAYATISAMDTPVKVRLTITITIVGFHHQQIAHNQLNPNNKSILGRAYANLFQNLLTEIMNSTDPIPRVHQTKGLTCRRTEKMPWAITLLQDPDNLRTYEEYARVSAYEADGAQPLPSSPPSHKRQNHVPPREKSTERSLRTGH